VTIYVIATDEYDLRRNFLETSNYDYHTKYSNAVVECEKFNNNVIYPTIKNKIFQLTINEV
jgi:hypothetical protein